MSDSQNLPEDPKAWKARMSDEDRHKIRLQIVSVLREAVGGAIDAALYNKLLDAATQFEDVVFHKAITKEEYARYISEKAIKIRNNGRKEFQSATVIS